MSKKLVIDKDLCIGCRACSDNYPEFFKFDDKESYSKVIAPFDESKEDEIKEAVDSCPAGAIKIEDQEEK